MSETPTPETDSVTRSSDETPWTPWVCAGHAKRLESERNEAREALKRLKKELISANRGAETNAKVNQILAKKLHDLEGYAARTRDYLQACSTMHLETLNERDEARRELAELKTELARVSQMDQHADKSSVGDSTYVLTQQSCQRASRVGMETDWTAIGYREGMSAALHSGGIRGAKWHAERKGIQGEAADNYISGFNAALDEYEQEEA